MSTTQSHLDKNEVSRVFIKQAQDLLLHDYLPKIESCLRLLTDEQTWWRPNAESNSIGNLLLHLAGNVRQWIVSGLGGQPDERVRQTEFDEQGTIPKDDLLSRLRAAIVDAD